MQSTDNITLNRLLTTVARQKASDLHLTIGSPPVIRREGELFQLDDEEIITVNFLERVVDSILDERSKKILADHKEVTLTRTFNKVMRCRLRIYKQKGYYSLSFRYIPLVTQKIKDLSLPQHLETIVQKKKGLIIITGVYDSGKSTTVAAIINTLNELGPPRYINILEVAIEHMFANNKCIVEQREVGRDVASYLQGLKLSLDGDIDIVVIDAVPNGAVAKEILEVLEAGRTVILSIEASSSVNALAKLLSLVEESERIWAQKVLASRLLCVLMQKLVHRIGGGRVLVYEFLANIGLAPSFIATGKLDQLNSVLRNNQELGIKPIERGLADLVQQGELRLESALLEANDKDYLKALVR